MSTNRSRSCGRAVAAHGAGAGAGAARAGHDAAEATEVGGGGDRGLGVVVVEHAAGDEDDLAAELGPDGLAALGVAIEDHDVRALADEVAGGGLTEAGRPARDEDGLPDEVHQAVAFAWSSPRSGLDFSKRPVS